MLAAKLAYVTVIVRDVEAAATVFERDFGLRRFDCTLGDGGQQAPVLRVGDSALVLAEPGAPFVNEEGRTGVHHIALAVEDLDAAAATLQASGIQAVDTSQHGGLNGQPRLGIAPEDTAGVRVYCVEPLSLDVAAGNGSVSGPHCVVERLDHIGVASADNTVAIETFAERFGFPVESTQTDAEVQIAVESFTSDKYGVVYHTRPPEPVGGLRVAFITIGDCELEFLQDFDPRTEAVVQHGQAGNTRQDRGAIARYVASRGPGLHHLAFKVPDANAGLAALQRAGHRLIDTVGRSGSRRAQIGFVHPQSLEGLLVHLVQRDEL
ncbi:VOC family protein [Candidatus Entotheonella palauensis]|uniref:VOC family protein n=1 Tax=Candidatus Entotheonella palauensis TaxID=93172 RepID=UPI0015C431CF|nr:VOC family protein [Candidatus Entotheonella palauensis]